MLHFIFKYVQTIIPEVSTIIYVSFFFPELEKPVISNFRDITISQDDVEHFNISCVANGNPPPSVSWKFNNKSLEYRDISTMKKCHVMNPGIYYLSGVDNVLVFCSLNFALHGGEYECIAENKVGRDTKKMMLKINGNTFLLLLAI